MVQPTVFVYITYIQGTPEMLWKALTDPDLTAEYWGHSNVSDWRVGSTWEHRRTDGSGIADVTGTVVESLPPYRLAFTFGAPTTATFEIAPFGDIVRVTLTHEGLKTEADYAAVALGWPAVMANLKTLIETGHVLPQAPWEMPAAPSKP